MAPHTILFMAANPVTTDERALDAQARAIHVELERAAGRDCFRFETRWAAQPLDLLREMVKLKPTVVHFCGGRLAGPGATARAGGVYFQAADGRAQLVSAAALASAFNAAGSAKLVVLDACYTEDHAEAVAVHVDCVVGMAGETVNGAAMSFAIGFYGGLGEGESVGAAFKQGCAAIALMGAGDIDQPRLCVRRGVDASGQVLTAPRGASPRAQEPVAPERADERLRLSVDVDGLGVHRADVRQDHRAPPRAMGVLTGAGALVAGAVLVGWIAAHPTTPPKEPSGGIVRGMVRFEPANVQPGVFDGAQRPACPALTELDDCAQLSHPDQVPAVQVDAFELDVHEVSTAELAAWLNASSGQWQADEYGALSSRPGGLPLVWASPDCVGGLEVGKDGHIAVAGDKGRWPAVCVTWYGATEYCRAQHKRLPLTAEWEWAAKGSRLRPFPWGSELPKDDGVSFASRDVASAHPRDVASSPQDISPEGVHDLGGSAAEWVEDGGDGDNKVIRGGSWASRDACHLLGSGCKRIPRATFGKDVGFRCASSVIEHNSSGGCR